jgi:hypothetical protein
MYYSQNNITTRDNKSSSNRIEPSDHYIDLIDNNCSCPNCDCKRTIFLKIIYQSTTDCFCNTCAVDLKFHGIAEEVISIDNNRYKTIQRIYSLILKGALQ